MEQLKTLIRDVPDFPQAGVVFKDITPLLAHPGAFSTVVDTIVVRFGRGSVDKVVGIEARGFIVAAPVAYHFNAGFVPVRKAGKLPWESEAEGYELEYGTETLEIHRDALVPGERVLIVVHFGRGNVDKVVGIEARGFILAAPVAYHFGAGIIPVRKAGKLPAETIGEDYALEYGTASLVERIGGKVCGIACLIELEFLKGRQQVDGYDLFTLIRY